jgi:hypothetical protein
VVAFPEPGRLAVPAGYQPGGWDNGCGDRRADEAGLVIG